MPNQPKTNEQYVEFYDPSGNLVDVVSLDFLNSLKELQEMRQQELENMLDEEYDDYRPEDEIDWEYYEYINS